MVVNMFFPVLEGSLLDFSLKQWYLKHKERHLLEQAPLWSPTPKVESSQTVRATS